MRKNVRRPTGKATRRSTGKAAKASGERRPARTTASAPGGKTALLKRATLFSQLSVDELALIARYSGYRRFAPGEVIFSEGSHREELYLVQEGSVSIRRRGDEEAEQEIARFVDGEVFGEMDLLGTEPRSASAVADGETTLLVFPRGMEFARLLEKHPETFARDLFGRVDRREVADSLSVPLFPCHV